MNSAFLYIKPHAATDKAKALVERELKNSGLSIVSDGTMQTNDIKTNPRIVHFSTETMPPDGQIFYYVVQWSETNMSWHTVRSFIGETSAQGIRAKIRSTWRELLLEEEPRGANDSLYFSDSALSGLADRMEWLGVTPEADPTGSAIASAGPELLEEARHWVRNVSVDGKPALVLCRAFNTSELIAALRQYGPQRRAPLEPVGLRDEPSTPPPVADSVYVDDDFRNTEVSWSRLRDALRSNPAALVPQTPCAEHISPADDINGCAVGAIVALARHGRSNIDRLFVTKTVRSDGHYVVRLFRGAAWHDVSVDDAVPVSAGRILYIGSRRGQWWPLLLYKALARLWGSYRIFRSATFPDVMHALTGKPAFAQYLRPRTSSDGVEIAPATGYLGDPTTGTFWMRLGNRIIKDEDIVTCRVSDSFGPAYGLEGGASLVLSAAAKVDDMLVFKVYRPGHTYRGPFGPGSEQLESSTIRDKLRYEEDESQSHFFVPQATLVELTDFLVITNICANSPIVVTGPWERKMGLPGSTLFRRGVAIRCTNKASDEVKLAIVVKQISPEGESSVGVCALRSREGGALPALLTGNVVALRDVTTLAPGMNVLHLPLAPAESQAILPVCDPPQGGTFALLFYGPLESIAISQMPEPTRRPIDWSATTRAVTFPQRLLSLHVAKPTPLAILAKRRASDGSRVDEAPCPLQILLYRANTDDVVATMDRAFGLAEVALNTSVPAGSFDVAVAYAAGDDPIDAEAVRLSVFANDDAEVVLGECRDVEGELLADARHREGRLWQRTVNENAGAVASRPTKRVAVFFDDRPYESIVPQTEMEL